MFFIVMISDKYDSKGVMPKEVLVNINHVSSVQPGRLEVGDSVFVISEEEYLVVKEIIGGWCDGIRGERA